MGKDANNPPARPAMSAREQGKCPFMKRRVSEMKAQLMILFVLVTTLPVQCWGQQKAKPKDLTIEDILSCAVDPLISSVFGFDGDNIPKLIPQAN